MDKMICTTGKSGKHAAGCYYGEHCCSGSFGYTFGVAGAHKRKRRYFKRAERADWKRQVRSYM